MIGYGLKECYRNKRFSLFLILNLSLAWWCFSLVDSLRISMQSQLLTSSKMLMSADIRLDFSERLATEEELRFLKKLVSAPENMSEQISLFTMARSKDGAMLVDLHAISDNFPLYGEIILQGARDKDSLTKRPEAWIYPEIRDRLGLRNGDKVKIGETEFVMADVVINDPPSFSALFGFSPRVYIHEKFLRTTKLLGPLSRYKHNVFLKFASETQSQEALLTLSKRFAEQLDVRVASHQESGERFNQGIGQVLDYLGLMALIALLMTIGGCAYLTKSFLDSRITAIAILKCLGLSQKKIFWLYSGELLAIGWVSGLIACLLTALFLPTLSFFTRNYIALPVPVDASLSVTTFLKVMLLSGSFSWCFALPFLRRLKSVQPSHLFRATLPAEDSFWRKLSDWAPFALILLALTFFQAQSWKLAWIAVTTFGVTAIGISLLALSSLHGIRLGTERRGFFARQVALFLTRKRSESLTTIFALSLSSLFVCLIPQLYLLVQDEIMHPTRIRQPQLFVIDIQKPQLEPLRELLQEEKLGLENISPMVSANLTAINGRSIEYDPNAEMTQLSKEKHYRQWAQRRSQNLSYRAELNASEQLLAGQPFSGVYDWQQGKEVEVSLEERYAERLGVGIGDHIQFDVQGLELKAKVINLRKVKWTSFYPNFFVLMQPGVLEDAPQVFLASIHTTSEAQKLKLQTSIVKSFSNISVVDISLTLEKILSLVQKMTTVVSAMALFVLLAGLAVIYSLWQAQVFMKARFAELLKIVGLSRRRRMQLFLLESIILIVIALSIGGALSLAVSYVFATELLRVSWQMPWSATAMSLLGVGAASLLMSVFLLLPVAFQFSNPRIREF